MSNLDLTGVIEDAISDSELPTESTVESTDTPAAAPDPVETTSTDEVVEQVGIEVKSPGAAAGAAEAKPEPDEFEKKFGIPATGASGRENRIPHSRVQKIVAKAVKDAESPYLPKIQQFEAKVADYEGKLQRVAEFENIMVSDQPKFLQMLATIPGYAELLAPILKPQQAQATADPAQKTAQQLQDEFDGMPQPDYELADGTKVYSMDGLKARDRWQEKRIAENVIKQVESRYAPIEQSFQAHRQFQEIAPKIQAQIAEARTWPLFNENEEAITQALQSDQRLSLEGAYRRVVFPKITADRNKMRQELMAEIKAAPGSSSVTARASRPGVQSQGPRTLTDIIQDELTTRNML